MVTDALATQKSHCMSSYAINVVLKEYDVRNDTTQNGVQISCDILYL